MSRPDRFADALTATFAARRPPRRRLRVPPPGRWLAWYTAWVAVAVFGFTMLSLSLAGVVHG